MMINVFILRVDMVHRTELTCLVHCGSSIEIQHVCDHGMIVAGGQYGNPVVNSVLLHSQRCIPPEEQSCTRALRFHIPRCPMFCHQMQ